MYIYIYVYMYIKRPDFASLSTIVDASNGIKRWTRRMQLN